MKVSLFVPCLIDRYMPEAGIATARLLESVGVGVRYDPGQTCCGQPAFNAGHDRLAVPFASRMLDLYADDNLIVVPSGSCVSMIRDSYGLLELPERDLVRWKQMRSRFFELSEFLFHQGLHKEVKASLKARAVVHQTCHHLRNVDGKDALAALLEQLEGLEVLSGPRAEQCCGFGGIFSVKLPELSIAMARDRLEGILALKPDVVAMADAGCILQLRGVLDGMKEAASSPPIVYYAQLFTRDGLDMLTEGR